MNKNTLQTYSRLVTTIRVERQHRGWTQKYVADTIGSNGYGKIETHHKAMTVSDLILLAKLFDLDLNKLLKGE